MYRELPEQEGVYERRRQQAVNRDTGQTFGDAVDSLEAYNRAWIKFAMDLPEWIDESVGQLPDGTDYFTLDLDGIGSPLA